MAKKKPEPRKKAPAELPLRVAKHIDALGLGSVADYLKWCATHGFVASTEKSSSDLEDEKHSHRRQITQVKARQRAASDPRGIIEQACKGNLQTHVITNQPLRLVCDGITASDPSTEARNSLRELLLVVHEKADFLTDQTIVGDTTFGYIDGLIALNRRRHQWLRSLDSWTVRSHNSGRQFSSLARHLLAIYAVPPFMDSVWFRRDHWSSRMQDWFILLGTGQNLRKAETPIPLTKKMVRYFLESPDHYSIEHALRRGQVYAMGGDHRLVESLLGTRLGNSFEHDDFWVTVIRFFVDNPMFDRTHLNPIVDYLQSQKYETQDVFPAPGVREQQPPPQPNLSMKGRTPGSLLAQVNSWHRRLGRNITASKLQWKPCGIQEFELETGNRGKNLKVWTIKELLSSNALVAEGRAMHHCVATYAGTCAAGRSSIWTLELHGFDGIEKRQTIEVNRNRVIVQSRGKYNALPNEQELQILGRWATEQGLQLSRYISNRG